MAIFSCISPTAHGSVPRRRHSYSGGNANTLPRQGTSSKFFIADAPPDSKAPLKQALDISVAASSKAPTRDLTARDLARRPGSGAKLQKRRRISKSVIGTPKDFVHCSHLDKAGARPIANSPEMIQVVNEMAHESGGVRGGMQTMDEVAPQKRQSTGPVALVTPAGPKTTATTRRKAPPPITKSLIQSAGLRESKFLPKTYGRSQKPPKKDEDNEKAAGLAPEGTVKDLRDTRTAAKAEPPVPPPPTFTALRQPDLLAPPAIHAPKGGNKDSTILPPTNSAITRDIERMLFEPIDGMPESTADPTAGLAAPEAQTGLVEAPSQEQEMAEEASAGAARREMSSSGTLDDLKLSPSMHNIVQNAVDVGNKENESK